MWQPVWRTWARSACSIGTLSLYKNVYVILIQCNTITEAALATWNSHLILYSCFLCSVFVLSSYFLYALISPYPVISPYQRIFPHPLISHVHLFPTSTNIPCLLTSHLNLFPTSTYFPRQLISHVHNSHIHLLPTSIYFPHSLISHIHLFPISTYFPVYPPSGTATNDCNYPPSVHINTPRHTTVSQQKCWWKASLRKYYHTSASCYGLPMSI